MRTVLHLVDTTGPGGGEGIFLRLVDGLDPERWRSHTVVQRDSWVADALEERGHEPLHMPSGPLFELRFPAMLASTIRRLDVDLVQTHFLGPGLHGGLAGRISGVPVVCTLHGENDLDGLERGTALQYALFRFGVSRTVLVSDSLRETFHARGRYPRERSVTIHNGIDLRRFRPGTESDLRRSLGFSDDDVIVGAVGNVRPPKAYDVLLHTAARVAREDARVRVVIAGDHEHPLYDGLLDLRRELGMEDRVHFLGYRDDVERLFRCFDVFVCSSRSEGFSLTTVQAMASGVPVVATRSGGPEDIVRDGTDGLLVEPDAPGRLAAALLRILRDRELRTRFSREGPERAEEAFSMDRMLRDYERLYEELLEDRKRS